MENQTPASFDSFGLSPQLLSAIAEMGYKTPTPIQVQAIPEVLSGRDIMGAAQTGTGKTASFGLPILQKLLPFENSSMSPARHPVRALILAPTRELAMQNEASIRAYAAKTKLRVGVVYGGVDINAQILEMRKGVEILIATPGRLLDLVGQKVLTLSLAQIVVLDEADRMLDMGFLPDIVRILHLLPRTRQSLMFSATFSPEIKKLANEFLNNPKLVEVARENSVAATIKQVFYSVPEYKKTTGLVHLLRDTYADIAPVLIFVNAKIVCRRLAGALKNEGFDADSIHGDKTQEERTKTLDAFKNGSVRYLVATDVAARGLDIASLPLVINYDVPFNPEDYVHRIGRTGRAGAEGLAVTLVCDEDDRSGIREIEALTKNQFVIEPLDLRGAPRPGRSRKTKSYEQPPMSEPTGDPFFDEPYIPSGRPKAARAQNNAPQGLCLGRAQEKKHPVAALLGGMPKLTD